MGGYWGDGCCPPRVTRVDEDSPWSVNAHLQTQGLMGDGRLSVKGQVSGSTAAPKTTSIVGCVLRGTGEQETEGEMVPDEWKGQEGPRRVTQQAQARVESSETSQHQAAELTACHMGWEEGEDPGDGSTAPR